MKITRIINPPLYIQSRKILPDGSTRLVIELSPDDQIIFNAESIEIYSNPNEPIIEKYSQLKITVEEPSPKDQP